MYSPVLELQSFDELSLDDRKSILRLYLEALIGTNRLYIRKKRPPALYAWAPSYVFKVRPFGLDSWQDIPRTMALRSGDCKDFACWRVAELREAGMTDVFPRVIASGANGMIVYHIQVVADTPNGPVVEDPSARLGMPPGMTEQQARSLVVGPQNIGVQGIAQTFQRQQAPQGPRQSGPQRFPFWYLVPR